MEASLTVATDAASDEHCVASLVVDGALDETGVGNELDKSNEVIDPTVEGAGEGAGATEVVDVGTA